MSGEVGKALAYEDVHPASLVIGRGCGKPKFFRCTATRWCVRRLQEAANGWAPTGEKWWDKWEDRLETWVQDDLLRARHKVLFEQVWAHWEDLTELAKQARVALDIFVPLLKADENRCAKEKRERWTKFKEAVAKGDAAGFRIIKEKCQEKWAGEKDVSNVAQLRAQAVKWAELWAAQADRWDIHKAGLDLSNMECGQVL